MIGEYDDENCPVDATIQSLTNKWVLQIIKDLFIGKKKFSEFKKDKPHLTNKALSRCLKHMETNGLIEKITTDSNIEYKLSPKGLKLNKVLYELIIFSIDIDENEDYDKKKIKDSYKKLLIDSSDITIL